MHTGERSFDGERAKRACAQHWLRSVLVSLSVSNAFRQRFVDASGGLQPALRVAMVELGMAVSLRAAWQVSILSSVSLRAPYEVGCFNVCGPLLLQGRSFYAC